MDVHVFITMDKHVFSLIIGYHIERRFGDSPRWLQINRERVESLEYEAVDLVDEYAYEFRFLAVNKVNVGEPSVPTEPVVPKDPFSKYLGNLVFANFV